MRQAVNPRKYREIVEFYRWDESQNNRLNEPQRVPKAVCRRMAEVMPLSGRELWQAQQVDERISYRVEMPYDTYAAAMTSKEWLVWVTGGGKRLEIVSLIDVDNEHQVIQADCAVTT